MNRMPSIKSILKRKLIDNIMTNCLNHYTFDSVSNNLLYNYATDVSDASCSGNSLSTTKKLLGPSSLIVASSSNLVVLNTIPTFPSTNQGNGFAISYWIASTNTTFGSKLQSHLGWSGPTSTSSFFHVQYVSIYNIQIFVGNGISAASTSYLNYTASSSFYDMEFHHIVVSQAHNGGGTSTVTLYIDGKFATSGNYAYSTLQPKYYYIGHRTDNLDSYFTGYIDQFRFFDRTLNINNVRVLYNNGFGI